LALENIEEIQKAVRLPLRYSDSLSLKLVFDAEAEALVYLRAKATAKEEADSRRE
jgi:hypothetical protein